MNNFENKKVGYQFTPTPKQLMHLLDVNCRTMLFALVDDSDYFANTEGWFYRTNSDLQNDSKLSKNLVTVTIDTLFRYGIVDVSCVGKGKRKQPNGYRLCSECFPFFEQLNMNTEIRRPENQIKTIDYKGSGYSPSYLQDEPLRLKPMLKDGVITWIPINAPNTPTPSTTEDSTIYNTNKVTNNVTKSDNNIDNIKTIDNKDNINNKEYIDNIDIINNKENSNNFNNNILEENSIIKNDTKKDFKKDSFKINIESNGIKEEETLVRQCEEANSDESQPKDGMKEDLNKHQLIENKGLSPTDNKRINKLFNDLKWVKDYPSVFNAEPIEDETYNVLIAALEEVALSTREQYQSNFERIYMQFKRIRESHTKEQMKPYSTALRDMSNIMSDAFRRAETTKT